MLHPDIILKRSIVRQTQDRLVSVKIEAEARSKKQSDVAPRYTQAMLAGSQRTMLFDLDGTLIDTIDLILKSFHHTTAKHGLPSLTDDEWLEMLGTPLRVQFQRCTESADEIQELISTYVDYNLKHHDDMVEHYPGVCDAVRSFHGAGFRLGVVTSKMHGSLERGLSVGGYDGLFEVLIGADDVKNSKPHPEPVLMALERLGVDPEAAIFVGDSPHDMASGRAAGVRVAAATWGPFSRETLEPHEPNCWLEQPADLRKLL